MTAGKAIASRIPITLTTTRSSVNVIARRWFPNIIVAPANELVRAALEGKKLLSCQRGYEAIMKQPCSGGANARYRAKLTKKDRRNLMF
jgi:hypothetical protein